MKLVFIGIQGSGKGTQARNLVKDYNFGLFETGQALRNIPDNIIINDEKLGKINGKQLKIHLGKGGMVTPNVIEQLLLNYINVAKNKGIKNIIFDGLIRNKGNKETADKILKNYTVVYLKLDKNTAFQRLVNRKYNPKTGATYPGDYNFDPFNGIKLIQRTEDTNKEAILKRFNDFENLTIPVLKQLKKEGKKIIELDASLPIDVVYYNLKKELKLK